ncbi:MAG: hypothetical protein ACPGKS_04720 [Coraliomargarita sp.]
MNASPYFQMEQLHNEVTDPEVLRKAERARKTIYIAMGVLIILPLVLAWLTGSLSF